MARSDHATHPKRAIIYLRVSHVKQEDNYSLSTQEKAAAAPDRRPEGRRWHRSLFQCR